MAAIMNSINFELLRSSYPELADLGGFAEQYVGPDPSSALVKLRSFVEIMVGYVYQDNGKSQGGASTNSASVVAETICRHYVEMFWFTNSN
jgi:hypothetical protein